MRDVRSGQPRQRLFKKKTQTLPRDSVLLRLQSGESGSNCIDSAQYLRHISHQNLEGQAYIKLLLLLGWQFIGELSPMISLIPDKMLSTDFSLLLVISERSPLETSLYCNEEGEKKSANEGQSFSS